jgi:hypothetical protein
MNRRLRTTFLAMAAALTPIAATVQIQAQERPHTAWGAPDLGGIWDFRTMTPLERPRDLADKSVWTEEEAAAYEQSTIARRARNPLAPSSVHAAWWLDNGTELTDDRRTSLIIDPPDGRIPPLTPDARQRQDAHGVERPVRLRQSRNSPAHGPEDLGIGERCLIGFSSGPPITPSAYNNNLMVFQTPDHVVLLTEMVHEVRVVPLDGRPHLDSTVPQWLGDSRGHWDGDTLVVDSTNFTTDVGSFSTLGNAIGSGETLHLIERFTRVDDDTLLYEFTIDDPHTFTRRFTAALPMRRTEAPLYEFACHEGNRGLEGILRGARAQERAAH